MVKLTQELYTEMIDKLDEIELTSTDNLKRAELSCLAIQQTLARLKEFIIGYEFNDIAEEVLFFKEIKPKFLSALMFYQELFYIEAKKPKCSSESQKQHFRQVLERINSFFERNHMIYIYYRMDKSDMDESFFVRGENKHLPQPEYSLDIDSRFSTIHSYKFAKIQAYEMLNDHIQQSIFAIDNPDLSGLGLDKKKQRNFWTDTKAALIELAYALHARGSVNHGKGDVKQLVRILETLFNIQVGNFYRTFQSMRIRKKNRTPFLDGCKSSLERWMDDADLNYS